MLAVVLGVISDASIPERDCISRLEADRFAEIGDGAVVIPGVGIGAATVVVYQRRSLCLPPVKSTVSLLRQTDGRSKGSGVE
jgi:hypothetical protein